MNSQPNPDLEVRLQQLEAELNSPPLIPTKLEQTENSQPIPSRINKLFKWFNGLSNISKLAVIGVAVVASIAILRVVLQLVATVISLAILALLLYFGYQFFRVSSSKTINK